jgi:hypothetical protein
MAPALSMKTFLLIMVVTSLACGLAPAEVPALYKMSYGLRLGSPPNEGYTVVLQGESYTTRESLMAAVERIPQLSRIVWNSGCIAFPEIPLGPKPRMSMSEFKAFCGRRLIRFDAHWGYTVSTSWKTFAAPPNLFAPLVRDGKSTDVRAWFKEQGVSFPGHTFAVWQPAKRILCVRNTQENVDAIEAILEDARAEAANTESKSPGR